MQNQYLFNVNEYTNADVDNNISTPTNNPAVERKEDKKLVDIPTSVTQWSQNNDCVQNVIDAFISGKTTADELIAKTNAAADEVLEAIRDIKGGVFLVILQFTKGHFAKVSYSQFIDSSPERQKFICKSDYYALRNYFVRYYMLPNDLKEYLKRSKLTNAKLLLNMPDINDAKIKIIQNEYPNAIPCKNKFVKLLLPPTPPKIKKPKGKPRCMSLRNIIYVYHAADKNTNRILNSLDILHSDYAKNQVLRQKYEDFNAEITAILAELEQSAKRTTTTKNRKENALS